MWAGFKGGLIEFVRDIGTGGLQPCAGYLARALVFMWVGALRWGGGGVRFLHLGRFVLVLAKFSFYIFGAGHWAIALCGFGICLISLIS